MVDYILWFFVALWFVVWITTFIHYVSMSNFQRSVWVSNGAKFKYGVIDVLGILSLAGIVARHW